MLFLKAVKYAVSGVWWSVLAEVVAAIYSTENNIKRQWLLDALDVACVADHPSTVIIQVSRWNLLLEKL
jgi:hypothetical protein